MIVFGFGAMLAGFAGAHCRADLFTLEPGMGDDLLIVAFVVIIIGGIGSIRGAFIAALLVGLIDTLWPQPGDRRHETDFRSLGRQSDRSRRWPPC